MNGMKNRRRWAWALSALLLGLCLCPGAMGIESDLYLHAGQTAMLPRGVTAHSSSDESLVMIENGALSAQGEGEAQVSLRLFGFLPLENMRVQVEKERILIPGGHAVGVAIQSRGVMVVGVAAGGPSDKVLEPGDMLLSLNGEDVFSAEQVTRIAGESKGEVQARFTREGHSMTGVIIPQKDASGQMKMGLWVRSSTAGVGTLTFYDPESGLYGALGHAVNDGDTGEVFSVRKGRLLSADIVDVKKGMRGAPGELRGSFLKNPVLLGNVTRNSARGVYGQADAPIVNPLFPEGLPMGSKGGVHEGRVQILSTVDENGMRLFEAQIIDIPRKGIYGAQDGEKSFVLHITDPQLIEKTGGIVQGMSGSPIIQDGKLIGAVTHVFVDDPTRGYGIFIENMLDAAG